MRLSFSAALLALAVLAEARSASAEECTEFTVPDVADAAAVKEAAAADAAVKLANEKLPGDPDAALMAFNMALSLRTQRCNPEVLVQVAEVREARNEATAAWEMYHLIESIKLIAPAALPAENPWRTATQKAATSALRVAKKIGIVTLKVTGADAALVFAKIDGAPFGDLRRPRALPPGKHQLLIGATGEGFRALTRDVEITAGTSLDPIEVKTEDLEILLAPRPLDLDDPSRADARSKFDAGSALAAEGERGWGAAYEAFSTSLRARHHLATEYNRALCAQHLGQLITARRGFAKVAKAEGAPELPAWVVKRAKRNIKALDEQVGRVILRIREPGVAVTVDDAPLEEILFTGARRAFIPTAEATPLARAMPGEIEILLDPYRTHRFVISKAGFETDIFNAEPSSGKVVAFDRSLRSGSHLGRNIGLVTIAAGLGAMVAGGVVGNLGDGEIKAVLAQHRCVDNRDKVLCADGAALSRFTAGNRKATIGNVLLPAGGVIAAGGAVAALIAWAPWSTGVTSPAVKDASPTISAGLNGLFVSGRFW